MYIGTKLGKILAILAVCVVSGCATAPDGIFVEPVDRAYQYYLNHKEAVDSDTLVALLSYSSAYVRSVRIRSWKELETTIAAYDAELVRRKYVAPNYPVAPSAVTLAAYMQFTNTWRLNHKDRLAIAKAPQKYTDDVNNLIFRIINNEYTRQ